MYTTGLTVNSPLMSGHKYFWYPGHVCVFEVNISGLSLINYIMDNNLSDNSTFRNFL